MTSTRTSISLTQAAAMLGIGRSTSYMAAHDNEFPVPVIKIRGRFVVPVRPLLDLLGLDELPPLGTNDTDKAAA